MRKGYGKATIAVGPDSVVKFGMGAREQGRYMMKLGDEVCPTVWEVFESGYVMQKLDEPQQSKNLNFATLLMHDIFNQLETYVWKMPARTDYEWKSALQVWMLQQGHGLGNLLNKVYPNDDGSDSQRIHGDPTFSNALFVPGTLSVILADPIEPIGKIPSYPSVDLAKIAQSVIGWEHVAHDWPLFGKPLVEEYVKRLDTSRDWWVPEQNVKFWLMVHLVRIKPYVTAEPRIETWAHRCATHIYTHMEEPLCDTLMTLTELSRSHGKRSTLRTKRSASRRRKTSTIARGKSGSHR